ncbi:uncharacterized protein [Prorops nasuta]|uniref:uncharacterized protein n=1 Tax=Prorops nasuta TaxID=863751 RepID=UPI0034CD28CD
MARILPFFQLTFVVLVLLLGLKSSETTEIKCNWCKEGKVSPAEQILCNVSFPLGVPLINGTAQKMQITDAENEIVDEEEVYKEEMAALDITGLSAFKEYLPKPKPKPTDFLCFKAVYNSTHTKNEAIAKGCARRDFAYELCKTKNATECFFCDTNLCNAAGSIKFSLVMILVPIVACIFTKS